MLKENIRSIRKARGLSQEELAARLNVVRQTISKWEQGRSVPDADMLISISKALETPVEMLLCETTVEAKANELKELSERLEHIRIQLMQAEILRRKRLHRLCISLCALILIILVLLIAVESPYRAWDYSDPETAVAGAFFHAFEWFFVRLSPFALAAALAGAVLTRRKAQNTLQ